MDVRTDEEFITVGIDPHKNTVVAFFFNVTTKEKWTYRFPATPLAITAFAQNCLKRNMLVGIEEGPNAYAIASILKEYVDRLLIICREKRSGKVKTDEIDAERNSYCFSNKHLQKPLDTTTCIGEAKTTHSLKRQHS